MRDKQSLHKTISTTNTSRIWTIVLLVSFFAGPALESSVSAGVIVSNLTAPPFGALVINTGGGEQAQEFTTGSQSVELADVIASLGAATAPGSFTASAELVADSSGVPSSTVLTSFTVPPIPSLPAPYSNVTFTPTTSGVVLSANTNYWFVLAATGAGVGSYNWQDTLTTSTSLPKSVQSFNFGATWSITNPGTSSAGTPFLIEVDSATPVSGVPEPASLWLALIGSVGMFATHRRFGRRKTQKRQCPEGPHGAAE